MIKTLEQLAGWLLFSLSILMVYGLLSMFLIDAARAGCDLPMGPGSLPVAPGYQDCGADQSETTDDSQPWVAEFMSNHGFWSPSELVFASKEDCEAAIPNLKPEGIPPGSTGDVRCTPYRGAPPG